MGRCEIDDAYHAVAAYHAHILLHPVGLTLVDGDEIVFLRDGVRDYLGRNKPVALQRLSLDLSQQRTVGRSLFQPVGEHLDLALQVYVAGSELLIDISQGEISRHLRVPFIELSRHHICRGEPHAPLVSVTAEKPYQSDNLE